MFDFFKKIKKTVDMSPNQDNDNEEKERIKTISGHVISKSAKETIKQTVAKYAKPDTYTGNRNLYDSSSAKKQAKTKLFNSKKDIIDPYTGDKLVLTIKEAKKLYGEDWQKHLAESDHIKPLEKIYEDTKGNAWVKVDDIKSAANSDDNIMVASRKFNNPKRSRTNKEYVENDAYLKDKGVKLTEKGKESAIYDGEFADTSIRKQLRRASKRNVISTGHEAGMYGAQNAGITTMTTSSIMNMVAVIKGEKNADEAIIDIMSDSGKSTAVGYAVTGSLTLVSNTLSNSSSKFLQTLSKLNVPERAVSSIMLMGNTLKRYSNGEITTQECIIELGDKGLNLATAGYSSAIGQALIPIPVVGAAIGALVGSIATSKYYATLINRLKIKELEHEERMRIIAESEYAAAQARAFRQELETYLKSYFQDYQDCFDEALNEIKFAFQSRDANGIIAGANKITKKLGGKVNYETVDEFVEFLNSDTIDTL